MKLVAFASLMMRLQTKTAVDLQPLMMRTEHLLEDVGRIREELQTREDALLALEADLAQRSRI